LLSKDTVCQSRTKRILRCYLQLFQDLSIVIACPKGLQLVVNISVKLTSPHAVVKVDFENTQ